MLHKGLVRVTRPYQGDKAIKGLERPGGGPRERYHRVLHKAFKGLIRPMRRFIRPLRASSKFRGFSQVNC